MKGTYYASGHRFSHCDGTCGYTFSNRHTEENQEEEDARVKAEVERIRRETG